MTAVVVFVLIGISAGYVFVRRRARSAALPREPGHAGRAVIAANLAASRRR